MRSIFTLRRSVFGAVLLGSALALSATADPARTLVSYQDLDLSSPQDAKVLYGRIDKAARRVCQQWSGRELRQLNIFRQCRQDAIANAVAEVNQGSLTALHQSRTQRTRAS